MAEQTLMIHLAQTDVTASDILVTIKDLQLQQAGYLLKSHGTLNAPNSAVTEEARQAYTLMPSWGKVENADYYEIEFQGQRYSHIQQLQYMLENLVPEQTYELKVRAVNADGTSQWTTLSTTTKADPLEHAIHGIKAQTTCNNQGGQGVAHLFDFDESSVWHTAWSEKAVPFDIIIDLKSVNVLDKLQYLPRPDAANGTIRKLKAAHSMDRNQWTEMGEFTWARNADTKQIDFTGHPTARFIRLQVTEAVGNFGSGQQIYVFRVPDSEYYIPGDINQDGKLDENDLTSYMNYTGLREGDGDFGGYISKGDLNHNGLIDAYDISAVAVELENGVSGRKVPAVAGSVSMKADKTQYNAGDDVWVTLTGKGLTSVNAISLAIPYDAATLEYVGVEAPNLSHMYNMVYDRLHTNGQKALYPTFVNLGEKPYLEGDTEIMKIHFRAKAKTTFGLKMKDGLLVDKDCNAVAF